MAKLIFMVALFVGSTSFGSTLIGHIANYDCSKSCWITVMGVIDFGNGSKSTQIMNLNASQFSGSQLDQIMDKGILDIRYNANATGVISLAPHIGKVPCGNWQEWTNCPAH